MAGDGMKPRHVPASPQQHYRLCRHLHRPGMARPGYCGVRTDTAPAYGPGHPLHVLPADLGAGCEAFERWQ